LNDVAGFLKEIDCDVQFTKLAEARDFRETLALREEKSLKKSGDLNEKFPIDIFDNLEKENDSEDDELKEFA